MEALQEGLVVGGDLEGNLEGLVVVLGHDLNQKSHSLEQLPTVNSQHPVVRSKGGRWVSRSVYNTIEYSGVL